MASLTIEEGYKLFLEAKDDDSVKVIDAVAGCLFNHYDDGIGGYDEREQLREHRPTIYELLAGVQSQDDFAAIIAQFRIELQL